MLMISALADYFQLFGGHSWMRGRIIAIPFPQEQTPYQAQCSENKELRSPARHSHYQYNERRPKRAAESRTHEENAMGVSNFAPWKPSGETSRNRRKCARFSDAE